MTINEYVQKSREGIALMKPVVTSRLTELSAADGLTPENVGQVISEVAGGLLATNAVYSLAIRDLREELSRVKEVVRELVEIVTDEEVEIEIIDIQRIN